MADPPQRPQRPDPAALRLQELPGLARIAASAGWHTSGWALRKSLHASQRLASAAVSPESALGLAHDVRTTAQDALLGAINATDIGRRAVGGAVPAPAVARRAVADAVSPSAQDPEPAPEHSSNGHPPQRTLRADGEQLLRLSRDVQYEVDAHPAYERILSELAPDEGRVLRLLLLDGPQAAVDVRTGGPLGLLKSRLLAPGLSMIGARAGCRYVERVPSYLNNLFRLGLIWFSRETLRDHSRYQVLEAQPEVLAAIHSVSQTKIVRRSIHLTPFGEDFCRTCLTPEATVVEQLPAHSAPPETKLTARPPSGPSGE